MDKQPDEPGALESLLIDLGHLFALGAFREPPPPSWECIRYSGREVDD